MDDLEVDWVYPPPGVDARTLWDCFHDARIESITTNAEARSLTLRFDVQHFRRNEGYSADQRFVLTFERVTSVRAWSYSQPPGPRPDFPRGTSADEQSRVWTQYWGTARKESVSWGTFESAFVEDGVLFDVYSAELLSDGISTAMRFQGHLDDDDYFELTIAAARANLTDTEDRKLTLDSLVEMGAAYWDALARKSQSNPAQQ